MIRQYELTVRQEPKQARMCGIGGKADRRPIDPPVIVQLRVIDPAASDPAVSNTASASAPADGEARTSGEETDDPPYTNLPGYAQSFLQNPYYFMFASLAKPDDDTELHWLKDGRTRCTTGSVVSSLYALKDPTAGTGKDKDGGPTTASPASDAGFFVFPDLSVRTEGSYRLKLSLFEVVGNDVRHCKSIYSAPFYVYTAKKFPGVEESSPLTCSLADQGIKIRIRKDIRMRKARSAGDRGLLPVAGERGGGLIDAPSDMGALGMPTVDPDPPVVDDSKNQRPAKRSRIDDGTGSNNTGGAPPVGTAWPSTPLIPPSAWRRDTGCSRPTAATNARSNGDPASTAACFARQWATTRSWIRWADRCSICAVRRQHPCTATTTAAHSPSPATWLPCRHAAAPAASPRAPICASPCSISTPLLSPCLSTALARDLQRPILTPTPTASICSAASTNAL
ncbi:velvet factor-domain-containing protein [Roridomyces roridus]|uniref:Velvet factor-domain-containing protein n=1 Tax=Roridomyces roridus TaxID=1738132 RepID=A0AAD7C3J0_9AGAR|nr:velvet factor-domain-containing protein [Roridomyces roridus]